MKDGRFPATFSRAASEGRPALVLFLTAGFPDLSATRELVPALVEAGADIIELGVPFSDPLADGATIQAASFHALQQGVTLEKCLKLVSDVRPQAPGTPLLFMGYYNPFLRYGLDRFAEAGAEVGLDGVIVPDLPAEESGGLAEACAPRRIAIVPLVAPTSTDARLESVCRSASGFVYCVSVVGVTGARDQVSPEVFGLLERVRRHTPLPRAVGFGISRLEHVQAIGGKAEAVVVGSALVKTVQEAPRGNMVEHAQRFVQGLVGPRPAAGRRGP